MARHIVRCLVMVALLLPVMVVVGMADDTLVLYLTFDEDPEDVVNDVSPHGNHGKVKGEPIQVDGKFGLARQFDGVGDALEIPHHVSLNMRDAVSIEMWVKLDEDGGADSEVGLEKGGWEAGEYSLYTFYVPGNGWAMQLKDLPEACGDANGGNLGADVRDGEWHFLAGVWDGDTISLYTDGILELSFECAGGPLGSNKQSIFIGARTASMRWLKGVIDEVRVYSRALSEQEVKTDMETLGGLAVSVSGKLAVSWADLKILR